MDKRRAEEITWPARRLREQWEGQCVINPIPYLELPSTADTRVDENLNGPRRGIRGWTGLGS